MTDIAMADEYDWRADIDDILDKMSSKHERHPEMFEEANLDASGVAFRALCAESIRAMRCWYSHNTQGVPVERLIYGVLVEAMRDPDLIAAALKGVDRADEAVKEALLSVEMENTERVN